MDVESDSAFIQSHNAPPSKCKAKFYPHWKRNNFKSAQEGKEVGEYRDHIIIFVPGSKDVIDRPVQEKDKQEYMTEWMAYQQGKDQRINGTPVELLPGLPKGMADRMKANYVYSIEQLADLSEPGLRAVGMGSVEWKTKAQAYLQKNSAEVHVLKQENEALKAQLAELAQRLSALESKPRRGRPPKVVQ